MVTRALLIVISTFIAISIAGIVGNIVASQLEKSLNDHPRFRFLRRRTKLIIFLLIFCLLSIPSIVVQVLEQKSSHTELISESTLIPWAFATSTSDETLILIANFHSTAATNSEPHIKIRRKIEEELKQLGENKIHVAVEPSVVAADARKDAEDLGKRYHASMVIWGEDTGVQIIVNFLNLKEPKFHASSVTINETERTQLANPAAYAQFIIRDLPDQFAFLSLFSIGQSYSNNQDYPHATRIIESAIAALPSGTKLPALAEAHFMLGWLYGTLSLHDLSKSIVNLDKAIALKQDYAEAYINRGVAYYLKGNLEVAIQDYTKAIALNPNLDLVYNNRGLAYDKKKELNLAVQDYDKALTLNRNNVEAYANRGLTYKHIGNLDQAIKDFTKALTLDLNFAQAYLNRGLTYFLKGNLELALEDYNRAIALMPDYAEAYNNRGLVYNEKRKLDKALEDYNKAIALKPDYAEAYTDRGLTFEHLGKLNQALGDYNKAIALNPKLIQAYVNQSRVYKLMGKLEQAIQDLTKAIDLNPNDAEVYYWRGLLYVDNNELNQAIQDYTKSITLNPNNAEVYFNRGYIYNNRTDDHLKQNDIDSALKDINAAVADYNKAIALKPDYAEVYFHRGILAVISKDFPQAIRDFEFFIGWSQEHNQYTSERKEVEEMVVKLKAGKDPLLK